MANNEGKMSSWQIFWYARKHLGRSLLYQIFGKKNARTVDRYCEDPRYTLREENEFNPIKGVRNLLNELDDRGHCTVVRAAVDYMVSGTSLSNGLQGEVIDLLDTMVEEKLADYEKLSLLHRAIENGMPMGNIIKLRNEAIAEIERTVAKYREELG